MIYRIIVALAIIVFLYAILKRRSLLKSSFRQFVRHFFVEMFRQIKEIRNISKQKNVLELLKKSFFSLTVLMFLVLAISSLIPVLILGEPMSGLLLIIHVTAAPVFVLSVTISVVLRAHNLQFSIVDIGYLKNLLRRRKSNSKPELFNKKVYFWLFTIFVIPAILSVLLSMYPFFGTEGQMLLLDIHRFSVLVLMIVFGFAVVSKYSK